MVSNLVLSTFTDKQTSLARLRDLNFKAFLQFHVFLCFLEQTDIRCFNTMLISVILLKRLFLGFFVRGDFIFVP